MAHKEQKEFFLKIKEQKPRLFDNCNVLDVGSLDINGNNHYLFTNYNYLGIDVGEGKNVDVVSPAHLFKSDNLFDVVISSECFEHDMYYDLTIKNIVNLTKSGGMFIFSCASDGRPEHGTLRSNPGDAPLLNDITIWSNYYKNLTEQDIRDVINVEEIFSEYYFETNEESHDLYFYGIKK